MLAIPFRGVILGAVVSLLQFGVGAGLAAKSLAGIGFGSAASGAMLLARSVAGLLNPLKWVRGAFIALRVAFIATGIGALVAGLAMAGVWIYNNWSGLKSFFQGFGAAFMSALGPARPLAEGVINAVSRLWTWVGKLLGPLDASAEQWAAWGQSAGQVVGDVIAKVIDFVGQVTAWFGNLPNVDWSALVGVFTWENVLTVLNWASYLLPIRWLEFIPGFKWSSVIDLFTWDNVLTSLNWVSYLSPIRWLAFIPSFKWSSVIDIFTWDSALTALSWISYLSPIRWLEFIPGFKWSSVIDLFTWDNVLTSLNWVSYLSPIRWLAFIPSFKWSSVIDIFTWDSALTALSWISYLSPIRWLEFIPGFKWSSVIDLFTWDNVLTSLNWASYLLPIRWLEFIPGFEWSNVIDLFTWDNALTALNWISYLSPIRWLEFIPSFEWSSALKSVEWLNFIDLVGLKNAWKGVTDWLGDASAKLWDILPEMPEWNFNLWGDDKIEDPKTLLAAAAAADRLALQFPGLEMAAQTALTNSSAAITGISTLLASTDYTAAGARLMQTLADGIRSKVGEVTAAAQEITRAIRNALPKSAKLNVGVQAAASVQERATGGGFNPGWLLTGERGPELEYRTKGGYIAHHKALQNMVGMSDKISRNAANSGARPSWLKGAAVASAIAASSVAVPAAATELDRQFSDAPTAAIGAKYLTQNSSAPLSVSAPITLTIQGNVDQSVMPELQATLEELEDRIVERLAEAARSQTRTEHE